VNESHERRRTRQAGGTRAIHYGEAEKSHIYIFVAYAETGQDDLAT